METQNLAVGIALCGAAGGLIAIGMSLGNALEMTNFPLSAIISVMTLSVSGTLASALTCHTRER